MSKAQTARLVVWLACVLVIVLLVAYLTGTSPWGLAITIPGLFVAGFLSERAFKHLASPEEVRKDLEDRVRNGD